MVREDESDEGRRENDSVTQVAMRHAVVCSECVCRYMY